MLLQGWPNKMNWMEKIFELMFLNETHFYLVPGMGGDWQWEVKDAM